MTAVTADMSMSLDGFIAGPNDSVDNPLGDGGERLHEWVFGLKSWRSAHGREGGEGGLDDEVLAEAIAGTGATVMGRRMFDHGERPWGEDPPFHHPVFVLTHRPRQPIVKEGDTTFTFVADGIESALRQARDAAGGRNVAVAGGQAIRQFIRAGLLDEIQIHLVPILLGDGVRLFGFSREEAGKIGFECIDVRRSSEVAHIRLRVAAAQERDEAAG